MSTILAKSRRAVVIDALVDVVKRAASVRGAEHDVPFDVERGHLPFAYVYDTDESYDVEAMGMHADCTLSVEVDVVFEYAEQPNRLPRVVGQRILAEVMRELAQDYTLGGAATNLLPQSSAIRELATESGKSLAAVSLQYQVRYTTPLREPFGEHPPE